MNNLIAPLLSPVSISAGGLVRDSHPIDRRLRLHGARLCEIARGPDNFANILHALGMPAPDLLAWATVLVELLGGLAVFVGAFIPLASVPMAFVLLVAIVTVHLPYGFSSIKLQSVTAAGAHFGQPGYETDLLYLVGLAALVLGGSGPFSLDQLLIRRSSRSPS
jgi:putative oxidoreductase